MDLSNRVGRVIVDQALLSEGQTVVVGVSGGADSLCLLDCLQQLGYRCVVAHLDHGLRPGSRQAAKRVAKLAQQLDLPFEGTRVELAASEGSIEEAARKERYRFLVSVAHSHQGAAIAVGHTADDQAETVLMHLLRGAGPDGLSGMRPASRLGEWAGVAAGGGLTLLRPLLKFSHAETLAHCQARRLEPIIDETNFDVRFFRNRLRHQLLPELRKYNPKIEQVLARTAQVMAGEAALVEQLLEQRWPDWARQAGPSALALGLEQLRQAPVALRRAALRRAILQIRPDLRDVGFEVLHQVVQDLEDDRTRRRTITGGLEVIAVNGELVIRSPDSQVSLPAFPQLPNPGPHSLSVPGRLDLLNGWRLESEAVDPSSQSIGRRYEATFDFVGRGPDLSVRSPRPGDRISPRGMYGSQKLSDLFINRKIPWPARERWPVVCEDLEPLWVVGLHVSRLAEPTSDSALIVRIRAVGPRPQG